MEPVTIAVLLGSVGPAYRALGGSALVANVLRTYIFGKYIRTLEVPDGELISMRVYRSSSENLRKRIASAQPPPFPTAYVTPQEVRQMSVWTPPSFTEPIRTDTDVGNLESGAWVLWSKLDPSDKPIPRRLVKLDVLTGDSAQPNSELDIAIELIQRRIKDRTCRDTLMDLAIDAHPGLLALVRKLGSKEETLEEWDRHALRLVDRTDTRAGSKG